MTIEAKEYRLQGAAMMEAANFEKAKDFFERAIEIEQSAELYIDLGNANASNGEYDEAVAAFNRALIMEPKNGEAMFNIGSVYLLQGKINKTLEFYNKAEENGFHKAILYTNLSKIYREMGDIHMVVRNLTRAIDSNPLRGDLYVEKVQIFIELGRFQEALLTLDEMKKILPEAFEVYDLSARIYHSIGNDKKAEEILQDGIKKFPADIFLKLSMCKLYVALSRIEEAKKLIAEAKTMENAEFFKRAIAFEEISIYTVENDKEQIKCIFDELLKDETEECDEHVRYMYMMLSILDKEYEKVLEMAEKIERTESGSQFYVAAIYHKGEALLNLGKEMEAKAQFKEVTKKLRRLSLSCRTHYECYTYRALAHKQIEEYDKAIEMAEYIEQLQPERSDGNMLLADIYKAMGDEVKSKEQFELAQKKNLTLQ